MSLSQTEKLMAVEIAKRITKGIVDAKEYAESKGFDDAMIQIMIVATCKQMVEVMKEKGGFTVTRERMQDVDKMDNDELLEKISWE